MKEMEFIHILTGKSTHFFKKTLQLAAGSQLGLDLLLLKIPESTSLFTSKGPKAD